MTFIQAEVFGGGGGGVAHYLDNTYDPVALYLLNDNLSDSSASGFNDLSLETGTEQYADVGLGLRGFYFDGASKLVLDSVESSLQITGDITLECIINYPFSASELHFMYCSASGETLETNGLYQLSITANTRYLSYFAEYGSGVNISYSGSPKVVVAVSEPVLVGMVRSSNVITFYVNGKPIGDSSSTLTAPAGGTSTKLNIGTALIDGGVISSVKVIDSALTADQMKAEFNLSLGPVLGELP
jgi:hypothetical protein